MSKPEEGHVGFKSYALLLSLLLGAAWTIFEFVWDFLPAEAITLPMIQKYLVVLVIILFFWNIFIFLIHMLFKVVFKAETKYFA